MNEQSVDQKIKRCKIEKKWWIVLLCWPVYIFLLWFIARLVFYIISMNWSSELINAISSFVNWIFWLLLMLYFFALPAWIILVVDGNTGLKKIYYDAHEVKNNK